MELLGPKYAERKLLFSQTGLLLSAVKAALKEAPKSVLIIAQFGL